MVDIANFLAQNSPRFNRTDMDRRQYGNALLKNDVDRIPQFNRQQDQQIAAQDQNMAQSRMSNARNMAASMFSAAADAADPIATGSALIRSQAFREIAGELKLPFDQFNPQPGDDPEQIRQGFRTWAQAVGAEPKGQEGFTLSEGQTRFGPNGQQVASVAKPQSADSGYTLSPGQSRYDANGRLLTSAPDKPPTQPAGQGFDQAAKLRAEFNSQTSSFRAATEGYRSVLAASQNPSAAGDIALIFSFMKTLDPNSTVREGEFATAQNAGGVPDRVRAQYNAIMNGQRLSEPQRQDFISQATNLYNGQRQGYDSIAAKYTDLATRAGLNPQDVIGMSTAVETGGNAAPEGTVISNGSQTLVKRNGQWVPQ